ncbi:MAG: S1 RNA-binding domain-containing protein [Myxococcales bacterium]|nr:MAG: S1 RNA-binding domain-containing protein [Myxococcales bacterium]
MSSEEKAESFASLLAETKSTANRRAAIFVGAKVDVVVTQIGKTDVFVTLDNKSEGYIDRMYLTDKDGQLTVEVGSRISGRIIETGGKAGAARIEPQIVRPPHDDTAQVAPQVEGPAIAEGLRVKGVVARVERYGVFVQINGTQGRKGRGLVPVSETGTPRGADLVKSFPLNTEVEAKILKIEEDGKIRLSFSALKADDERSLYETYAKSGDRPAEAKGQGQGGAKKGPPERKIGTFGELLQQKLTKK